METRLHRIWKGMKTRCNNPNRKDYKFYGGRGIKVCDEWINSFALFEKWAIQNGYSDELTIDRIDVNSNYEPSNCRWVDMKIQALNKTNSLPKYKGKTLKQISEEEGISYFTLVSRAKRNDSNINKKPRVSKYGTGISFCSGKYQVYCSNKYIGRFETLEKAILERKKAEKVYLTNERINNESIYY